MEELDQLDERLGCWSRQGQREVAPCTLVIFGASGDLTSRKLIPSLYHLFLCDRLPRPFRIVGMARRKKTDEAWRAELLAALRRLPQAWRGEESDWERFSQGISYCSGDLTQDSAYRTLIEALGRSGDDRLRHNLLFYLAVSPSRFAEVISNLSAFGLVRKDQQDPHWQRVVIEKPFGHDLPTALKLNRDITECLHEKQVFRIDHYLGKETVQNILAFRFSNAIFENLWNRKAIDHVQITVSECLGVGTRGGYYEEAGALRDMVQNHLLQVLALVAMEPPVSLDAEAIRDEKVKLLRSIRPLAGQEAIRNVIRGQYFGGVVGGDQRKAYRDETDVDPASLVETFVAMKLEIDNWRWAGVPFYLRTGKNLPATASEIRICFRPVPQVLFASDPSAPVVANTIVLRLQPDEGICLGFNGKSPGSSARLEQVLMDFRYDTGIGAYTPGAYERLLLEAMAGDSTLFIRRDEVESAWALVDRIRSAWADRPLGNQEFYAAGTWGPSASDELMGRDSRHWITPHAGEPDPGLAR